jgi:hypothetical protein
MNDVAFSAAGGGIGTALSEQEMAELTGGDFNFWYAVGYAIGYVAGTAVRIVEAAHQELQPS